VKSLHQEAELYCFDPVPVATPKHMGIEGAKYSDVWSDAGPTPVPPAPPADDLIKERDALREDIVGLGEQIATLKRERDEARGKAAWMMEAFWLAICDLGHSEDCAMAKCDHRIECPHVNDECTCPDRPCGCECTCWRVAADKVVKVEEAVQLCTKLRDAEDEIERLGHGRAKQIVKQAKLLGLLRECRPHVSMMKSSTSGRDFQETTQALLNKIDAMLGEE